MRLPDFNSLPPGTTDLQLKEMVALQEKAQELKDFIASTIERSIQQFVNLIEGRDVPPHEAAEHGKFVDLQTSANAKPQDWEKFFIYKQNVLAYRIIATETTEDGKPGMILDYKVQTMALPYAELPEAIKAQLA